MTGPFRMGTSPQSSWTPTGTKNLARISGVGGTGETFKHNPQFGVRSEQWAGSGFLRFVLCSDLTRMVLMVVKRLEN